MGQLETAAGRLHEVLGSLAGSPPKGDSNRAIFDQDRLVLKSRNRVSILRLDDLEWIEAAGDFVYLHSRRDKHLFRQTLTHLEAQLDPRRFRRIHRGTIVNLERIAELRATDHGEYQIILLDGTILKLSRSYRKNLGDLIG